MGGGKTLSPRHAKFVEEYLKDSNGTRAAIAAGYSAKAAKHAAWRLLHEVKPVAEAIAAVRRQVQSSAKYNLEVAMKESVEAMEFARETENANALVKAVELRTKLNGLLIEKHDVRQVGFQIHIDLGEDKKDE